MFDDGTTVVLEEPRYTIVDTGYGPLDNLAVPARRAKDDPTVLRGKALFYRIGCTGCHTPKHATRG